MKKYAEYLEEELRKLKGAGWRPTVPRPNFVRQPFEQLDSLI